MVVDVPPDTSAAAILSTRDCVSLWTLHDIDGLTTLVLTDVNDCDDCNLVFHGTLASEGRKLAFNNSAGEPIIEVKVAQDLLEVEIYANDPTEPSKIVCVATSVRA